MNIVEWIKDRYGINENIKDLLTLILQGTVCDFNKNHDRWGRFAKGKGGSGKRYYGFGGKRVEIAKAIRKDKKVVGGNKEVQKIYDGIVEQEVETTKALIGITKSIGAEMAGLEYCIKGGKSLGEKIERQREKEKKRGLGVRPDEEYVKEMTDVLRYTILGKHEDLVEVTENTIDKMERKGYNLIELDNKWIDKDGKPFRNDYHGIHLLFENKKGIMFEVQVHSPETFDIKMNKTHKDYEIARSVKSTLQEKEEAFERMCKCWDNVKLPKNIERLKTFWHD